MHAEAWQWLHRQIVPLLARAPRVIDLGGCDVNGSPRALFAPGCEYVVVDVRDGAGVDIVADATRWLPEPALHGAFDVVLCTETFEHVQHWRGILYNMWLLARPGGACLVTCATDPRPAHSIVGVVPPPPGEWYDNVGVDDLAAPMRLLLRDVDVCTHPRGDVYARGTR